MPTTSAPPPPPTTGGLKYAVIGVLFLGAGVGAWLLMDGNESEEPVVSAMPDAGSNPPASDVTPDIVLPDPEPEDAGPPDAGDQRRTPTDRSNQQRAVAPGAGCTGVIDPGAASRAINRNAVRACYERRLKVNNTLSGQLQLQLTVGPNGQVGGVQVGGTLRDPQVFACVREVASGWRFPIPQGGRCAVVSVPFSLTPRL